jgi:hypothetical protein
MDAVPQLLQVSICFCCRHVLVLPVAGCLALAQLIAVVHEGHSQLLQHATEALCFHAVDDGLPDVWCALVEAIQLRQLCGLLQLRLACLI